MKDAVNAARFAVSALGLAALAVSATVGYLVRAREEAPAPVRAVISCSGVLEVGARTRGAATAKLGEIAVVGMPEYDRVVEEIRVSTPTFATCALYGTGRVTIYAHVANGVVGDVTALGSNEQVGRCVTATVQYVSFPASSEPYDVMIPVELFETVSPE